jgi:hypothetical protein
MENKIHWINQFYAFEIMNFIVGTGFLYFGYSLKYILFSIIGGSFVLFGMIMGLMQKKKNY